MKRRIFYYAYSSQKRTGGQKQTYRHVDALNRAGLEAYVYHEREDFRVSWFENQTEVVGPRKAASLYSSARDYLVLPEPLGPRILTFPGKKVIFNKSVFLGFAALPFPGAPPSPDPYRDPSVVCAFVVSNHSARHLRYAYPDLAILNVGVGVDDRLFRPVELARKSLRVACVAKCMGQVSAICGLLDARLRRERPDISVHYTLLRDLDPHQVAEALADSLILLMCSWEEGLPQTVIEGILSGCFVVGPDAGALRGLVSEPGVDFGEPAQVADRLYRILLRHPRHPESETLHMERLRSHALACWSLEAERAAIRSAWAQILGDGALATCV